MGEMLSTEELIAVTYTNWTTQTGQRWMPIAILAHLINRDDLNETLRRVMTDYDDIRLEPRPFNHQVTEWERANCPMIGGEQRHLMSW